MTERSIGDVLRARAEEALHADFIDHANRILERYRVHRPRLDTGEWTIGCTVEINAYREVFSEEAGCKLHPLTIIWHPQHREYRIEIDREN